VCENLDVATKVSFGKDKRFRVVTTKGEVIETSGAMTGGGQPKSGLMSSKPKNEFTQE
jgi:structural maintenance of chromosome 4